MLAIPAIAGKGWLIVLDEKSHNSMFTGAYAAGADAIMKLKHNDMRDLQRILRSSKKYADTLVMVEGLYR
jgi:8-amino-7-oxononanoate synthase